VLGGAAYQILIHPFLPARIRASVQTIPDQPTGVLAAASE
jgi:hypothetical protein